jgi:hypothetical protein
LHFAQIIVISADFNTVAVLLRIAHLVKETVKEHFGLFFAQIFIAGRKWQQIDKLYGLAAGALKHIGDHRGQKRDGTRLTILAFNPLLGK